MECYDEMSETSSSKLFLLSLVESFLDVNDLNSRVQVDLFASVIFCQAVH